MVPLLVPILLAQVDCGVVQVVIEPWHEPGGVTALLQSCGAVIHANNQGRKSEVQTHLDTLQPGTWRQWQLSGDAVVL